MLKNEFVVNLPIEAAWLMLLNVERIAQCVPGGELLEKMDERSFKGRVSVKLGPMHLVFEGIAKFVEVQDAVRCARIEAQGSDKKGRGAAQAQVTLQLQPREPATVVNIATDLRLSGAVAQIGRASAVIEAVSRQLVEEFADNLNRQIAATAAAADAAPGAEVNASDGATSIAGFRFAIHVLWAMFGRLLAKLTHKPAARP
jgi:carbon monoxide dehydrogenase subunit G